MVDTTYIEQITGFSGTAIESVLEAFIKFIQLELQTGNEVEISKFGVFYPKELGERKARNPYTGTEMMAKPRTKPRIRFFKSFEESIQDPSLTSTPITPTTPPAPPTPAPPATSIPPSPPSIPVAAMAAPPPVPPAVVPVAVEVVRIWHIAKDGVSTAYPESKLRGKGKGKHNIAPDTLVWTEGQADWKPASEILPHLFA
jgi:Bacterial nucleoid DNA-binding protein